MAMLLAACAVEPALPHDTLSISATPSASPDRQSAAPPATAAPEVASPIASPPVDSARITWSEADFEGDIADLIGDGAGFIAVGRRDSAASAWSSTDGREWAEHDVPQQSFGELPDGAEWRAGMGALVRLGDTLYSFGGTSMFMDASVGAGWRSTDGRSWEAIESTSEFFGGQVIAVTASDEALVASTIGFGGPRGTLAMWRWTPATSWVRSSLNADIMVRALAWADGTFVAAGSGPSFWTSPDGLSWTRVAPPEGLSEVCDLTATDAGAFLAFGRTGDRIAAWTSADGHAWVESTLEPADMSGLPDDPNLPAAACKVVGADGGLIAAMLVGDDTLVWTSLDGLAWEFERTHALGATFGPVGRRVLLAAHDDQVLLIGSIVDPAESDGSRQVLLIGVMDP